MKKTSLFGLFCVAVILGLGLTGGQLASSEEPPAQAADTVINADPGNALRTGMDPKSALAELVRLIQAGVEEDVILAYIDNSLRLFSLDADDIIYLTDLGAPSDVIKAAMAHDERLIQKGLSGGAAPVAEAVAEVETQSTEVTRDDFNDTLSPYGAWVHIEGYGRCWRPTVAIYNTGWQPYCDNGRWIYTDHGWYWKSGYSWGSTAFHYGRWFRHSRYGWCWWPDTVWAPSWVCWRYDRSYCGWAPLPPHTVYRSGIGCVYRDSRVVVGFDFGLDVGCFTFVAMQHFYDPKPWLHCVDAGEAARIYSRTTVFQQINYDQRNRRLTNSGIPPRNITAVTRREIRPVPIEHPKGGVAQGRPHERIDPNGRALAVNRPRPVSPQKPASSSTPHRTTQQPNRSEGHGVSVEHVNRGSGNNHKPPPPAVQVQRKPPPPAASRPSERNKVSAPQKNNSNSQARKQAQNNHAKPPPQVIPSRPAKKLPPPKPAKANAKEKQKPHKVATSQ